MLSLLQAEKQRDILPFPDIYVEVLETSVIFLHVVNAAVMLTSKNASQYQEVISGRIFKLCSILGLYEDLLINKDLLIS